MCSEEKLGGLGGPTKNLLTHTKEATLGVALQYLTSTHVGTGAFCNFSRYYYITFFSTQAETALSCRWRQ
jgi:hypothetical protein